MTGRNLITKQNLLALKQREIFRCGRLSTDAALLSEVPTLENGGIHPAIGLNVSSG